MISPPSQEMLRACEMALSTNNIVCVTDDDGSHLTMVPDVIVAQGIANGEEHVETFTLTRNDGRKVYVYG